MKITCQSCQSKYNVADEKVHGKIVKIRCRKCGATIVVNGTDAATTANGSAAKAETVARNGAAAPAEAPRSDAAQWHVNIGENDQRTMTEAGLKESFRKGLVTLDTFIWTDGMDDWRPLSEVEALVAVLQAAAEPNAARATPPVQAQGDETAEAPPVTAPPARRAIANDAPSAAAPSGYAQALSPQIAAPEPVVEPKRAAVVKREARGRDLFGGGGGAEEVQTSAPSVPHSLPPGVDDGSAKLTGQRNENSVLFSLAVLTRDSDDRSVPVENHGSASKQDSGLIDLKALSAKTESMRPANAANAGLFAPPLGMAAPLGAPMGVLGAPFGGEMPQKSKLPFLIGAGAGVALLLVLGIAIGAKIAGSGNAAAASPATTFAPVGATSAEPAATLSAGAPAAAPEASSAASSAPVASSLAKPKPSGGGAPHPQGGAPRPPGGAAAASTTAAGGGGATAAPAPPPKKSDPCGCNGDLMCLMKCSTGH